MKLMRHFQKIGEEIYKKTGAAGTGGQQGDTTQEPPKDENKKMMIKEQ